MRVREVDVWEQRWCLCVCPWPWRLLSRVGRKSRGGKGGKFLLLLLLLLLLFLLHRKTRRRLRSLLLLLLLLLLLVRVQMVLVLVLVLVWVMVERMVEHRLVVRVQILWVQVVSAQVQHKQGLSFTVTVTVTVTTLSSLTWIVLFPASNLLLLVLLLSFLHPTPVLVRMRVMVV